MTDTTPADLTERMVQAARTECSRVGLLDPEPLLLYTVIAAVRAEMLPPGYIIAPAEATEFMARHPSWAPEHMKTIWAYMLNAMTTAHKDT